MVHLFKVKRLFSVLACVVVEYFQKSKLNFLLVVSILIKFSLAAFLSGLNIRLTKLVKWREKVNSTFISGGQLVD